MKRRSGHCQPNIVVSPPYAELIGKNKRALNEAVGCAGSYCAVASAAVAGDRGSARFSDGPFCRLKLSAQLMSPT